MIHLECLPNDDAFAAICAMVFGTRDPFEVAPFHQKSAGLMGRLVHVARMMGLSPPYRFPPEEILRLPAPLALRR